MAKKKFVVQGIPYDVEEGKIILHHPEKGDIELPLEWGQNAYAVAYAYLNRKGRAKRESSGVHRLGNFTYQIDENGLMTVTRKNGEILGTKQLDENQMKYPRTHAISFILSEVE